MKRILFFLFAWLTAFVAAYDLYGGYERMFYYYAYLIDAQSHGGTPIKIATGCAQAMRTGGAKCTFNQFIGYINDNTQNPRPVSITNAEYPDVDTTANALRNSGSTNTYNIKRIMANIHEDPGTLMQEIGKFIAGNQGSSTQLSNARTAIMRVQFLRGQANLDAAKALVLQKNPGTKIFTYMASLYSGGPQYEFFNKAATIKNNNGVPVNDIIDQMNKDDPTHFGYAMAATSARAQVEGCAK